MSRICLIDSRLGDSVTLFKESARADVYPIIIDVKKDTFDYLLGKIAALSLKQIESVAYVAHASFDERYHFTYLERTVVIKDIATADPKMITWRPFLKFISALCRLYRVKYLDMLGCSLAASPDWQYIFSMIELMNGRLSVRASVDDTGNLLYKGDWILEAGTSTPVDAEALYFTSKIEEFEGLLLPLNTTFDEYDILETSAGSYQTQWTNLPGTTGFSNLALEDNGYFPLISSQSGDGRFIIFPYTRRSAVLLSPPITVAAGKATNMSFIFSHDSDYGSSRDRIEIYALPVTAAEPPTEEAILLGTKVGEIDRFQPGYNVFYGTWVNYNTYIPYMASEIYVAIRFIGENGNNMYLDNIYFTEGQDFMPAGPPVITALEYNTDDRLIVTFNQPTNAGNPPVSRYYIECSPRADFSSDVKLLGHTDPTDQMSPQTHVSEYVYFTTSPIYVRVSGYNGTTLNRSIQVPLPGPTASISVSVPATLTVAAPRLVLHFDSFTSYTALEQVAPIAPDTAREKWISLTDPATFQILTTAVDPAMPTGYGGGGAWIGSQGSGTLLSPKINLSAAAGSGADIEITFAFGQDSFEYDMAGSMTLCLVGSTPLPTAANLAGAQILKLNRYSQAAPGLNTATWQPYTVILPNVTLSSFYLAAKFEGGLTNRIYFDNIIVRYKFKAPSQVSTLSAYPSGDNIVIYWTHLSPGIERGFLADVNYTLSYKKEGDSSYTPITTDLSTAGPPYYVFTPPDPTASYTFQLLPANIVGPAPVATFTANVVPCLLGSTRVLTATGWQRVDSLSTGDPVITSAGRQVRIKNVYTSTVVTTTETAPYRFAPGSIAPNYPVTAFDISPTHAIAVPTGGWIIPKHAALSGIVAQQHRTGERLKYYHVELPEYLADNLVLEAGAVVESFGASWLRCQPASTVVYIFDHRRRVFDRPAPPLAKKVVAAASKK